MTWQDTETRLYCDNLTLISALPSLMLDCSRFSPKEMTPPLGEWITKRELATFRQYRSYSVWSFTHCIKQFAVHDVHRCCKLRGNKQYLLNYFIYIRSFFLVWRRWSCFQTELTRLLTTIEKLFRLAFSSFLACLLYTSRCV